MKKTIEEKIEKEIAFYEQQIKEGHGTGRGHLDGYVLEGLKKKVEILNDALKQLRIE